MAEPEFAAKDSPRTKHQDVFTRPSSSGTFGDRLEHCAIEGRLGNAKADGVRVQQALKATDIAQMRTISADKVIAIAVTADHRPAALVDGWYLPQSPEKIFAAHQQNDVPALVGSTSDDLLTNIPLRSIRTSAEYKSAADKLYGPDAAQFLQLYPATSDEQARTQGSQVSMSSGLGAWAYSWALHQAENGKAPVWLFRFSRVPPYHPGIVYSDFDAATGGAYHSADVPYWLGTYNTYNLFRLTRDWTPLDARLSNEMVEIIAAFARTGDPNTHEVKFMRFSSSNPRLTDLGGNIREEPLNPAGMGFLIKHNQTLTLPPPPLIPGAPRPIY